MRSLILASNLLGARRICVVHHTSCAMVGSTEDEMRARVSEASGTDATGWDFLTSQDQTATLRDDIAKIRACPLIPDEVEIGGFIFDVHSGALVAADL